MSPLNRFGCVGVIAVCCLAGCGGGVDDKKWKDKRLPVFPVTGTVTYKGSPVADASVVFQGGDPMKPISASGKTDSSGRFSLRTYEADDGAVPGKHKVVVVKAETEAVDPSYTDTSSPNYGKTPPKTPTKYLVPEKYGTFDKSPLTADVSNSGKNDVPLDLKD